MSRKQKEPDWPLISLPERRVVYTTGRYSGYSALSIATEANYAQVTYRTFFEKRQRYAAGTDLTPEGSYYFDDEAKAYWLNRPKQISSAAVASWIKSAVVKEMAEKLSDEFTHKPVNAIFVEPALKRDEQTGDDAEYKPLSTRRDMRWAEFVRSNTNHVVRGSREFGKSTILKELAFELCSADETVARPRAPIIVKFKEIETTGQSFARLLRGNTPECPQGGFTLQQLSDDGYLCIMVDDVDFTDLDRIRKLTEFMKENPKNRYVLTALSEYSDTLGVKSAEFPVPVESLRIEQFTRRAIRRVVENLHPASKLEQEQLLNRILRDLRSMNVPCTAVNGAILLTVFQAEKSFVPVNRAIVLERFIEITLDRFALKEAARSTFDSTNKTHLLAGVAKWMCEQDKYLVDYSVLYEFTQKWLSSRALKYPVDAVLGELLSARILTRWANNVGFTYRSFLEYFVAKAMQFDSVFKSWITADERYLAYIFELEYYSGLDRNDAALLNFLSDKFLRLEEDAYKAIGFEPDIQKLEDLTPPPIKEGFDVATITERQLNIPPLTQEERDEIIETELPVDASHRQEVYRPAYEHDYQKWLSSLILYSRVFRNMEFISAEEKSHHLKLLLKSWSKFMMVLIQLIPNLAKNGMFFLNGIKYEVLGAKDMNERALSRYLLMSSPRIVSSHIFENLGTEKLAGTLEDDASFSDEPAISTFFRRWLYADLRMPEFIRVIGKTYEDLKKYTYLSEAFLWKVNFSYRRLYLEEHEDAAYRKVLAKILALRSGERGRALSDREAELLQKLERSRLVEVIRRQKDA